MNEKFKYQQLLGFAVTCFISTLLHFAYNWLNQSIFIAPFSSINESTWEHMKLVFWPTFTFALVQRFFFRNRTDFWCIKLKGILLSLIFIPVVFYTYNGAIGKSPDWFNVGIFFISVAITFIFETKEFINKRAKCNKDKIAFVILCAIALLFIVFTFVTPTIEIFKDPITKTYGINAY